MFMAGHDELGDLHSTRDAKHRVAEIDKDGLDLAAIIAVDSPRGVQDSYAVMERKPRARSNLRFEARRQGDRNTARDRGALHRLERDVVNVRGQKIEPCRTGRRVSGQGKIARMWKALKGNSHAACPFSVSAILATRRRPTSCLSRSGQ